MKPQPRYKPGDRIGGRYQVHKALMGGMGEVYLCLDLKTEYPYALKTFQQRYLTDTRRLRRLFEQEVTVWVTLENHPNIVRCFYMEMLDNQPFMKLEWVADEEGRQTDLRAWLRHGPLDLKMSLEIAIDICHGLLHAQGKQPGLVHRDLKPENILMAQGGLAKITDFGLTQIVATAGLKVAYEDAVANSRERFVASKGIVGTPAYMAPEQWRGEALDERADIYALGCILYELLTGTPPFAVDLAPIRQRQSQPQLHRIRAAHEFAPYPKLPAQFTLSLQELIAVCLAKARTDRPASLQGLLTHLTQLYQEQFGQLPPVRSASDFFTASDYNNRGLTYHALKKYNMALADYCHALELDPYLVQAYANRANTYADMQEYKAAMSDYDYALQLAPTFAKAYSNRGHTNHVLHKYEAALEDYRRALELDPNDAQTFANRGVTHADLKDHEAALNDFNYAIKLDPFNAQAYSNRGNAYYALGKLEAALTDFDHAVELDSDLAQAYVGRGNIYADQHKYKTALANYDQAIAIDPGYAQAYSNRGNAYVDLQEYDAALVDYTRAIELDSNLAIAYFNRGNLYTDLQEYDTALVDYHYALKLDPTESTVYLNIGIILGQQGRFADALPYLDEAARLGNEQGKQYANQVRYEIRREVTPPLEPIQQALILFANVDSTDALQQVVAHFPFLARDDLVADIENAFDQIPLEYHANFHQRLIWLRQIISEQNSRSPL